MHVITEKFWKIIFYIRHTSIKLKTLTNIYKSRESRANNKYGWIYISVTSPETVENQTKMLLN